MQSAPRMWRCFLRAVRRSGECVVCSTYVEVFLSVNTPSNVYRCLLHVCGGVSVRIDCNHGHHAVCSTYVEVFLETYGAAQVCASLLHVCGGVSESHQLQNPLQSSLLHVCGGVSRLPRSLARVALSAPRMWRCFESGSDAA